MAAGEASLAGGAGGRRVLTSPWDALTLGVLPLAATGFLAWVIVQSVQAAPPAQLWSLAGILAVGLAAMLAARFGLRSPFFAIPRESDTGPAGPDDYCG